MCKASTRHNPLTRNVLARAGCELHPFDFDSECADAPGCVLLKRSARLATAEPLIGHEWYYVDPAKGHAVVRAELFNLPPDTPADPATSRLRQTIHMEDFKQSPHGCWYCTVVHNTNPVMPSTAPRPPAPIGVEPVAEPAGNNPTPSKPDYIDGPNAYPTPNHQGNGAIQHVKTTVRYYFDFDADLPDSLFTVDDVQVPNQ